MTCRECERLEDALRQAQDAIRFHEKKIKPLDKLTYSEIRQIEFDAQPYVDALSLAKSRLTRHRKKCDG